MQKSNKARRGHNLIRTFRPRRSLAASSACFVNARLLWRCGGVPPFPPFPPFKYSLIIVSKKIRCVLFLRWHPYQQRSKRRKGAIKNCAWRLYYTYICTYMLAVRYRRFFKCDYNFSFQCLFLWHAWCVFKVVLITLVTHFCRGQPFYCAFIWEPTLASW